MRVYRLLNCISGTQRGAWNCTVKLGIVRRYTQLKGTHPVVL